MGMVVQHNMNALNAYNKLNTNVAGLKKSSEKLSSGYRINRAGDDAAGLAISEKMRSQIRGLTQAKRNSQDGISMLQTFEGATQESHSILQRMKELATESANGTYQDEVDRDAIQLEFNQLNDELDQIADTDFNGVVMLNGGEMADGLRAVDGKFDYTQKADQVKADQDALLADAQAAAQKKINSAQLAYDNAKAAYEAITSRDLSNNGNAVQWNTVDDSQYTSDQAEYVFGNITTTADTKLLTDGGYSEVTITFKYDADTANNGAGAKWDLVTDSEQSYVLNSDNEKQEIAFTADKFELVKTDNGGFKIVDENGKEIGNAILDTQNINDGDTVTLKFTNAASGSYAPSNIGLDNGSLTDTVGNVDIPTIELSTHVTDVDNMNADLEEALKKLDAAEVSFDYTIDSVTPSISDEDLSIKLNDDTGKYDISFTDSNGKSIVLASVTVSENSKTSTASAAADTITMANDSTGAETIELTYGVDPDDDKKMAWLDSTGAKFNFATGTVGDEELGSTETGVVSGTAVKGDKLTLSVAATSKDVAVTYTGVTATVGKLSFGIALDAFKFDSVNVGPTIEAGKNETIDDSVAATDQAYEDAKAALEAAKAAYPTAYEDLGIETGVSVADSNNAATAPLTYSDHLVLQTGSRTKDSVDFTFNYSSNGLGDLKANLNLSSREDGLNTKNLSLATQEDANAAIDKIDNAINKTSMVRATFGATQNRLEHKIENLTTNTENLTEAESTIRDTDMASEMLNYTKYNVLQQAAQSMLAQANQQPQSILQLLG